MLVQEVISKLQKEKQQRVPSRFHCRAIMVDNILQYNQLITLLKTIPEIIIFPIDELFSGTDVMPDYERMCQKEYKDKWFILPGVSEYLRLFHISEEQSQRFGSLWHYQFDANSLGRIIIPLWGCKNIWFDSALNLNTDERQNEDYFDCGTNDSDNEQMLRLKVLSSDFDQYIEQLEKKHDIVFHGIKEWYSFWYNPQVFDEEMLLVTKRFKSVRISEGNIAIHVVGDKFTFIKENLANADKLDKDLCGGEALDYLFSPSLSGESLDEAIFHALNVNEIKSVDVMSRWNTFSDGQRQLVLLWYKLHPDKTYLSHCVSLTLEFSEFSKHLLMDVFNTRLNHPEWVEEARMIVDSAQLIRTDEYYKTLDEIPSFEERIEYLTAKDSRERIYLLHVVGEWLRTEREAVFQSNRLKEIYPELLAYLRDDYQDERLKAYFDKYKKYKLSNTLPENDDLYFEGIDTDEYDYRYPVINNEIDDNSIILWIDALGAEWLPLLNWKIRKSCMGKVSRVCVAQSQLPSETRFNDQWNQMSLPYQKLDKLDKLAHKGVIDDKDYYACVEEQIQFICKIVDKINKLLEKYNCVILTGDHGTSRLAARFFHKTSSVPAPSNASVGSHGRFCKLNKEPEYNSSMQRLVKLGDDFYLVFSNYYHYPHSGFAAGAEDDIPIYGEIHGGATPEEMLVPVIAIKSNKELVLEGKWMFDNNTVKVSNKRIKCQIQFSKPVSSVHAQIGPIIADECQPSSLPSKDWTLVFSGMQIFRSEKIEITVVADGKMINMEKVTVIPALGGNDPF